jgi:tripartite-type tricarboxylate transporter receptor subunit TctC
MKRSALACLLFAVIAVCVAGQAVAQGGGASDYPNRPVHVIVPTTAGSGVDVAARTFAQKLTEAWGQSVVVENRAGANGIMGMEAVAKAKPDGYTLLQGFTSALTINPFVYKTLPYDTFRDYAPILQTVSNTMALVVKPSLPANSLKELIALGKSRELTYASNGIGNMNHLAGELLRAEAGLKLTHVPYKGESAAFTALISGESDLMFSTAMGVAPHIKSGKLRLLATCGEKRAAAFPDAPTTVESGLPTVVVVGWGGWLAPAGTPAEIIRKIQRDIARVLSAPDVQERLRGVGSDPVGSTPEEFAAFLKAEGERWSRASKQAGIYQSQ